MSKRKESCETCRFWKSPHERTECRIPLLIGTCKRYPPKGWLDPNNEDPPQWEHWFRPEILSDDWCGEWQPSEADA